ALLLASEAWAHHLLAACGGETAECLRWWLAEAEHSGHGLGCLQSCCFPRSEEYLSVKASVDIRLAGDVGKSSCETTAAEVAIKTAGSQCQTATVHVSNYPVNFQGIKKKLPGGKNHLVSFSPSISLLGKHCRGLQFFIITS
ncbi:hypothetical protein U0070_008043, partial [Myodes glareolus]